MQRCLTSLIFEEMRIKVTQYFISLRLANNWKYERMGTFMHARDRGGMPWCNPIEGQYLNSEWAWPVF